MLSVEKRHSRTIGFLALAACVVGSSTVARSAADVGTIVSMSGRPQMQQVGGKVIPARPLESLSPGARIILKAGETVSFCHESGGRTYKIEGAGVVFVGDVGVNTDVGGPKVTAVGKCDASPTTSDTGGVLSRGGSNMLKPPSSPK